MQSGSNPKDALVPLLGELYGRIYHAEVEIGLWAGENDHRPRIERFHDAVRAYTNNMSPYASGSRLAIEQLAWDISMLRSIQSHPLTPMPKSQRKSADTGLAVRKSNAVGSHGNARVAASAHKKQLGDDYRHYAVLFTALLATTADLNHQSRMDDKDAVVEELANLRASITGKTVNLHALAAQKIYDPQVLLEIQSLLPKGTIGTGEALVAINRLLQKTDSDQDKLDKAHITWLSGQLAMYEQGKEVVQELMRQGMNLAGRFLQDTMARDQGGPGRGF
ncbi:MAG: hypothetical protein P8P30_06655 [Rickettsiales bacterium]|nr:hypothetical protein [Rickettsiales bacterium]